MILTYKTEVKVLRTVARRRVDEEDRDTGLLGADQGGHDSLLGAGDDGQHIELAGDGVVDLLRLQCRIEMLTDRVHFHPERVRLGNESLGQRRDERVRRRRDEKDDLFALWIGVRGGRGQERQAKRSNRGYGHSHHVYLLAI